MNGVHDMGGMHGFGPIDIESGAELFHESWEATVLGLTLAVGALGEWNIDKSRHARECLPPGYYLTAGYYRIWLAALENLLVANELVTRQELQQGRALTPAKPVRAALQPDHVAPALLAGSPVLRSPVGTAAFAPGQRVVVRNLHPAGHTRVPGYVRGHTGTVHRVHGCHVFPDSNAAGLGEDPRWLYNIRFDAAELWQDRRCEPHAPLAGHVHVDLWEPYLAEAKSETVSSAKPGTA